MTGMLRVVGLDLSLRATGYADEDGARVLSSRKRDVPRLFDLRDEIAQRVDWLITDMGDVGTGRKARGKVKADLVVIEDYAFSRADAHAHALGELGGVVKVALAELSIETVLIGPSALKKFLTGKGNANKIAMATAAVKAGYEGPSDDNCIDAWALREMALYALQPGDPSFVLSITRTTYRDEAVSKVAWPELPARTAS